MAKAEVRVKYRELQRQAVEDDISSQQQQPLNINDVGSQSSSECAALLSCLLFAVDSGADVFALVKLRQAELLNEFWLMLACMAVPCMVGAAVSLQEMGVLGKVRRIPRAQRVIYGAGLLGLFALTPLCFIVFLLCRSGSTRSPGATRSSQTCFEIRSWLDCSGLLKLVLVLYIQVGAVCWHGLDLGVALSPSILVTFVLLLKVAAEHDTHKQVYLSLRYVEGLNKMSRRVAGWEECAPLFIGPLQGLLSVEGLVVVALRAAEVIASVGSVALFHAGTHESLQVLGCPVGGLVLILVLGVLHTALLAADKPWMESAIAVAHRAVVATCFCPLPVLDASSAVVPHYTANLVAQTVVFGGGVFDSYLYSTALPTSYRQAIAATAVIVWPLLVLARFTLAVSLRESVRHAEAQAVVLARKVKAGEAEIGPIPERMVLLPHMQVFALAFCGELYGEALSRDAVGVSLRIGRANLEGSIACKAFHLAEFVLRGARDLRVHMEGSHIEDDDLVALVRQFPHSLSSLEVNLAGTEVGNRAAKALAEALPFDLESLKIGLNSTAITDDGLKHVAKFLPSGLETLELILYNTQVSDVGMRALAKNMPQRLVSFRVGLSQTRVGDEGILLLMFQVPETVRRLRADLSGLRITDQSVMGMLHHLRELTRLEGFETSVSGTQVTEPVKALLKQAEQYARR